VVKHRQVEPFSRVTRLEIQSLDDRLLPLQVDGDYIGEVHEAVFGITPRGIAVVA
jgi:diacylglycerol kinase family enzyme